MFEQASLSDNINEHIISKYVDGCFFYSVKCTSEVHRVYICTVGSKRCLLLIFDFEEALELD